MNAQRRRWSVRSTGTAGLKKVEHGLHGTGWERAKAEEGKDGE